MSNEPQVPAPLYESPSSYFDHTDHQSVSNIFHRDILGRVVLQIRGDFSRDYARKLIAFANHDPAQIVVMGRASLAKVRVALDKIAHFRFRGESASEVLPIFQAIAREALPLLPAEEMRT